MINNYQKFLNFLHTLLYFTLLEKVSLVGLKTSRKIPGSRFDRYFSGYNGTIR